MMRSIRLGRVVPFAVAVVVLSGLSAAPSVHARRAPPAQGEMAPTADAYFMGAPMNVEQNLPAPFVEKLTVDGKGRLEIAVDTEVTLEWTTKHTSRCTLGDLGPVSTDGRRTITAEGSQRLTLNCVQEPSGLKAEASIDLVTFQPPEIELFSATPARIDRGYFSLLKGQVHQDVKLEWKVSGVETCDIEATGAFASTTVASAPKASAGIVMVEPVETSTISLKCTGARGAIERTITVDVHQGARVASWVLFAMLAALVVYAYRRRQIALSVWVGICGGLFLVTSHAGFVIIGVILACLLLGQPLFVLMGTLTLASLVFVVEMRTGSNWGDHLDSIIAKTLELATKEVLLAIPFFVLAGEVMTRGTLAPRLIGVARAVFGKLPGGLAISGVFGCVFFAAISGSSPVTVIAIGSIMVPAMVKAGYPRRFSMGLISTAGSLGILIPPSIPMIIYAIVVGATTQMDPKELFLAGVVPGALIGILLAGYSLFIGIRHKDAIDRTAARDQTAQATTLWEEMKKGVWSLLLPVIILGGIYSGVFTTTEAAAVSVVYAVVVEMFIEGELKWKDLPKVAESAMTVMGALFLIIALAIALNDVLVRLQVPDAMVDWLRGLDLTPVTFLIIVNLFLLVVGCFMDIISAILIVAPMLAPMSVAMGIHPLHMGIIFIVNLEIGYLTPPLGLNLFVASTLFKQSLGEVIRAVIAPLMLMFVGLIAITWLPVLSFGLPNLLAGKPLMGEEVQDDAPPPVDAPPPPAQGKTMQQMMEEAKRRQQDADGAGTDTANPADAAPKTIQQLMEEAKRKQQGGAEEAPSTTPPPLDAPKTIQQLMEEAKRRNAATEEESPPAESVTPTVDKPKTIQQLMEEAKRRKEQGQTP